MDEDYKAAFETALVALEDMAGEIENQRDMITHPNGRRSYFIDSTDEIRVEVLTRLLDKASAAVDAVKAFSK